MTKKIVRPCDCRCGFWVSATTLRYLPGHDPAATDPAPFCLCGCGRRTRRDRWQYHYGYATPPKIRPAKPIRRADAIPAWFASSSTRPANECWIWDGRTDDKGYGYTWWSRRSWRVHRLAWLLTYGNLNPDVWVLHRCDTPPCFNPSHLFIGDHQANMTDMALKDRSTHGIRSAKAKLTEEQIAEILRRAVRPSRKGAHDGNYRALAAEFGVHRVHISRICRGINWQRTHQEVRTRGR